MEVFKIREYKYDYNVIKLVINSKKIFWGKIRLRLEIWCKKYNFELFVYERNSKWLGKYKYIYILC